MNLDPVLQKVQVYTADFLEPFCQMLHRAVEVFQSAGRPAGVTSAHPLRVSTILAEWQVPLSLIETAAWGVAWRQGSINDFVPHLGPKRAKLATQLVKFNRFLSENRRQEHMHSPLYKTLLGELWSDALGLMLVASFLDTIRSGTTAPDAMDRRMLAHQARTVFEPYVAGHLGMWCVRRELLELAFQCEAPQAYKEAEDFVEMFPQRQPFIERVTELVQAVASPAADPRFANLVLEYRPTRLEHVAALLQRKRRVSAHELGAFVALLPDEQTCYDFVRVLQSAGSLRRRFKPNGYRSLHARLRLPSVGPTMFYIRTPEWHAQNVYGLLLSRLQHGEQDIFEEEDREPPEDHIFVYTDRGKRYLLPQNATPVDLAYTVHEMAGHRFSTACICGGPDFVGAEHCLEDGDIVEIILGQRYGPNLAWLTSVKTLRARQLIDTWQRRTVSGAGGVATPSSKALHPLKETSGIDIAMAVVLPAELGDRPLQPCTRCKPYPKHPGILAYVTRMGTITIHRRGCPAVPEGAPAVDVNWRLGVMRPVSVICEIEAWDRIGLLQDITECISGRGINIARLLVETKTTQEANFRIALHEEDPQVLAELRQDLEKVHSVANVYFADPQPTTVGIPAPATAIRRVRNPYSPQPVSSGELFFGRRRVIAQIWRALEGWEGPNSVFVWGQQRIGKTSLLMHLEAQARAEPRSQYVPVRLTMQRWGQRSERTPGDVVLWFAQELARRLSETSPQGTDSVPVPDIQHFHAHPREALIEYIIDRLYQHFAPRRLFILLDEFQRCDAFLMSESEPFGQCLEYFLDTSREVPFIFAAWGSLSSVLERVRDSAAYVPLGVLNRKAAQDLIRQPVLPLTYTDDVVEALLTLTHGHPYYIHLLCRDMVENVLSTPTKLELDRAVFDRAVQRLLCSGPGPFRHLLYAVSGSDTVLCQIARLASPRDSSVTFASLMQHLVPQHNNEQVRRMLKALTELKVVDQPEPETYRIQLPLLQQWIAQNLLYR